MKQEGLWIDGVFVKKPSCMKQEHLDFLDEFLPMEKYSIGALAAALFTQFDSLEGQDGWGIVVYWRATRG